MPPKKKAESQSAAAQPTPPGSQQAPSIDEGPVGSEETLVVPPAADEPVRYGGHTLTDEGWVAESEPAPSSEQE